MAEKTKPFSPLVLLGDGLLLLCALCGLAGSFLSVYTNLEARDWADVSVLVRCALQGRLFLTCAVLFALLSLAVWSLPRFRWAAAGSLTALWLLWVWWGWDDMLSGAMFTCKTIADLFAARVDWGKTFPFAPGLGLNPAAAHTRLFLLAALALLALVLGWAVVRARRWWLVLALTLPPLLPGLLADLYPDWPPFLALAACWCAMILCDLCRWAAPSARGKLTLIVLPCAAAALLLISLAFPREGYTRPQWALDAETALYNAANRAGDFFSLGDGPFKSSGATYVGSPGEADLAHAGPLRYFGRTVLRVTADCTGLMYLRGSSLAVYGDGVWKALPEGTYEEYSPPDSHATVPLYFPALLSRQDIPTHTVTVDNAGAAGSCVYAPYFPVPQVAEDTGALPVEDAYFARRRDQWTHTMAFVELHLEDTVNDGGAGWYDAAAASAYQDTAAYRDYVYAHYLDVPEEMRDELNRIFWEMGYPGSGTDAGGQLLYGNFSPHASLAQAERVAQYLDELCEYDPDTPAAPDGVDPVLWFLTESRRGYCMHYASAAALMLRQAGIPTRYVSGFFADCVDGETVYIPDRAAHAWVEIWLNGFGWYPVDVTPAAYEWYEAQQNGEAAIPTDEPSLPPEESEAPEPTPAPEPGQENAPAPSENTQSGGGGGFQAPVRLLKALGWTAGVAALLWLGWYLPRKRREQRINGPDHRRAGLACYGCLARLEHWGGRVSPRAVELAEKAKYSRQGLTGEEAGELRLLLDWERKRLCAILPPAKRVLFRYLWGMPSGPKKRKNAEKSAENGD